MTLSIGTFQKFAFRFLLKLNDPKHCLKAQDYQSIHVENQTKSLYIFQEEEYNTLSMNTNGLISPKHGPSIAPGATFMGPDQSVATVFDNPISKMNAKKASLNGHTSLDMEDGKRKANKPGECVSNEILPFSFSIHFIICMVKILGNSIQCPYRGWRKFFRLKNTPLGE